MKRLKNKAKQFTSKLFIVAFLSTPAVSNALLFDLLNAAIWALIGLHLMLRVRK
jgi:hypothetical protein